MKLVWVWDGWWMRGWLEGYLWTGYIEESEGRVVEEEWDG